MKTTLAALTVVLCAAIPVTAHAQKPSPLSPDLGSGPTCPLGRVATVRGSDTEASEGGGFFAARANGIHGAVDLNGYLGEAIFAVASGRAAVASRDDWGKLGKTVIIDHQDGGYTIYGHLHTVEVSLNSKVATGQMIGTIGYSGNAAALQAKNLPPHLHFAYVRTAARTPDAKAAAVERIKETGDGIATDGVEKASTDERRQTGVLDPIWAVKSLTCWEDAPAAVAGTTP
jgi:murein DD-endopeptidase MepM/ murein hydrolase activator NlpD